MRLTEDKSLMLWKGRNDRKGGKQYSKPTDFAGYCHLPKSGSKEFMKHENKALFFPLNERLNER